MLDLLYAQTARIRRRWYERHPQARRRLARPVISVGNLSVGGSGKTPLVAHIAAWLIDRDERPAILSRGYGRAVRADGVVVVSDGTRVLADLDRAGDEPLMLARSVAGAIVCVAEDRHLAGLLAERRLGATLHLLDDGFQHVQLARDLDILMTRPEEAAKGRVLPMGRLREGIDAAARADIVVVLDADLAAARTEAWSLGISQAVGARRTLAGKAVKAGPPARPEATTAESRRSSRQDATRAEADGAGPVVATAGIAHPDQFFSMLREAGYEIAQTLAFPDHHRYTVADVARIGDAVRASGAHAVVTTEKDAVRFEPHAPLPFEMVPVPTRLDIDGWDLLTAAIDAAIARAREAA